MSDYASGPEDETEESEEEWKLRMAKEQGMDGEQMPANNYEKLVFWERIHPQWRSDAVCHLFACSLVISADRMHQLGEVFLELEVIWWSSLSATQQKKFTTFKVTSTARSSPVPPTKAPYNFGIRQQWMDQHGEEYSELLADWGQYPDPPGFGSNAEASVIGGGGNDE